ncbi:MAG: SemiSWEET family sugar transporter [Myxococcales bacterium]
MKDWVGTCAAILTTISFLPQVVKVLRERQTAGISLGMYSLFTVGVALWLVYGLLIDSPPVWGANGVTLFFATIILVMKVRLG